MFVKNKYFKWYNQLVEKAQQDTLRSKKLGCYESHHIIPKSFGGDNSKLNLVLLTPEEHYMAHMMLVRCTEKQYVYKMVAALARFFKRVASSHKSYGVYKRTMSRYSSGEFNTSFGKIWIHNIETQEISYVLRTEFDLTYDKNVYAAGLPFQRGGVPFGRVWVNNGISGAIVDSNEVQKYIDNGWKLGKHFSLSPAVYQKLSAARHTPEKDKKHSETLTGKIAIRLPDVKNVIRVNSDELQSYLDQGYILHKGSGMKMTTSGGKSVTIDGITYKSRSEAARITSIPYHKVVKM